ncbi:MAG: hypothetical protein ACR2JY_04295 [Chloroflexota bacterium]
MWPLSALWAHAGALLAAGAALLALFVVVRVVSAARRRRRRPQVRQLPARRGPGRPRGSKNRPVPSGEEFLAAEMVRALRSFRRADPIAYRELMLRRVRAQCGVTEPGQFTIAEAQAMLKALKTLGLELVPRGGGHPMVEIADRLAPYTPQLLSFLLAVAGKGAPAALPSLPVRPLATTADGRSTALTGAPPDDVLADWVKEAAQAAKAEDVAGWIIDLDREERLGIVEAVRTAPDAELGPLWDQIARERGDLAPVVAWFRAWDRRIETLAAVRVLAVQTPASTAPAAQPVAAE